MLLASILSLELSELLHVVFSHKNIVLLAGQESLWRPAILLSVFVVLHAEGNLHVIPEPRDLNGYEYYFAPSVMDRARPPGYHREEGPVAERGYAHGSCQKTIVLTHVRAGLFHAEGICISPLDLETLPVADTVMLFCDGQVPAPFANIVEKGSVTRGCCEEHRADLRSGGSFKICVTPLRLARLSLASSDLNGYGYSYALRVGQGQPPCAKIMESACS